ncbi:MAG: RICIN domain-containing protein, partial [Candidatus Binatia bacterium]
MRVLRGAAAGLFTLAACGLTIMTPMAEAQTIPTGSAILINRTSGQCVRIPNASNQLGLQMVQLPCRGPLEEEWTLQAVTGGYRIVSELNGLCLEVANASTSNGAAIRQSTCSGALHQKWAVQPNGGSWFRLMAKHSSKCIAVGSRNEGTPVTQQACSGDTHRWTISASSLPSFWSPKVTFTLVPAAAANMPDGRLLLWAAYGRSFFGGDHGKTYTAIYNPAT